MTTSKLQITLAVRQKRIPKLVETALKESNIREFEAAGQQVGDFLEMSFSGAEDDILSLLNFALSKFTNDVDLRETRKIPPHPGRIIFINYRRADSQDITGRIYDHLLPFFGHGSLFWDYESIEEGQDFREVVKKYAEACHVMLSVIGPDWLESKDASGNRRLDDPEDLVRIEIETALKRGRKKVLVIPVLVNDAQVPSKAQQATLPGQLADLFKKNAVSVRSDNKFHNDLLKLIDAIDKYLSASS
jgi:hypothetical protein